MPSRSSQPPKSSVGSPPDDAPDASGRAHAHADDALSDIDIARLYQDALEGALKLVGGDGGELAMLDPIRHVMVVRARLRGEPGASGSGSAFGAPSRSSQPLNFSSARYDPSRASAPQPATDDPEVGEQPTVLLAAVPTARVYRQSEGLVGAVWQRGEAIALRGEEFRELAHGTGAPGAVAYWHAGVPIYRPSALDAIPPI